jgi:hypothetical protein
VYLSLTLNKYIIKAFPTESKENFARDTTNKKAPGYEVAQGLVEKL